MKSPTLEGTDALMKHDHTALILATGGAGLVKAAYSAGKPAFGVGPGNVPAYIEQSADIPKAVREHAPVRFGPLSESTSTDSAPGPQSVATDSAPDSQ